MEILQIIMNMCYVFVVFLLWMFLVYILVGIVTWILCILAGIVSWIFCNWAYLIKFILKLLVNIIYNTVRLISSYAWLTIGAFGGLILFNAFEGDRSVSSIIGGTIGYCIVPTLLYLFLKSVNF